MIDCLRLTAGDLPLFGIVFDNAQTASDFAADMCRHTLDNVEKALKTQLIIYRSNGYDNVKTPAEAEDWLKRNIPSASRAIEEQSKATAWYILRSRRNIRGAKIVPTERETAPLSALSLPETTRETLYNYGMDTVTDVIDMGLLSFLERNYPDKTANVRDRVLDYLFADTPDRSGAQNPPVTDTEPAAPAKDLDEILKRSEGKSPDDILDEMAQFIKDQAKRYKSGGNKSDYLLSTYPMLVAPALLKMKGVAIKKLSRERSRLKDAVSSVNAGRITTVEPWMEELLSYDDALNLAMEWFCRVLDVLLIPTDYYCALSAFGFDDVPEKSPKVIKRMTPPYENYIIVSECTDVGQITERFEKGREYVFHFADGTTCSFKAESYTDGKYTGRGVIEGFMSKPDRIVIEYDEYRWFFHFSWAMASREDIVLQTVNHPLPHPKWDEYNKAARAKNTAVAKEYTELREELAAKQ